MKNFLFLISFAFAMVSFGNIIQSSENSSLGDGCKKKCKKCCKKECSTCCKDGKCTKEKPCCK